MKIFYFTATGNCLDIAKGFDATLYSIPQVLKNKEYAFSDDKIGIICPVYHFGIPSIVEEFLAKVTLNSSYIFTLLTYGNMTGNAMGYIDKVSVLHGIKLNYINAILMVDNYLPVFDMDKEIKKEKRSSDEYIKKIIDDVNKGIDYKKSSRNVFETISTPIMRSIMSEKGMNKKFQVTNRCIGCGICQQACPKNNIKLNGKPSFEDRCISCLSCVNMCPQKSIIIKREKNSKARFRNNNVSLKEIIKANNQLS